MTRAKLFLAAATFLVCLTGCDNVTRQGTPDSIRDELRTTELQQERHLKTTPPPKLDSSLERKNLTKRLTRFNDENKTSYIYLIDYGKVMAFYTIKGKVSSVNSLLTQPMQPVEVRTASGGQGGKNPAVALPSPDLDGSYGTNGDAIFFFTTTDIYIEWKGDYMLCDEPLKLSTPPTMILEIDE